MRKGTPIPDGLRGRVSPFWVFSLIAVLLLIAGTLGTVEGARWRMDLVPAWLFLYIATLFFANAYRLAWERRRWFRAAIRLLTTLGGVASAAFVHFAEARGGPIGQAGELVYRESSLAHHVALVCVLSSGALMVVHFVFLGRGRRWFARVEERPVEADEEAPEVTADEAPVAAAEEAPTEPRG